MQTIKQYSKGLLYKVAMLKMYMDRGQGWLNYLKHIGYIFIAVSSMRLWSQLEGYASLPLFILLVLLYLLFSGLIGYFDYRRKEFAQREQVAKLTVNPIFHEILERLDRIESKIK